MTECKYAMKLGENRFGQPDIRCSGTKELDYCHGFDKCHQYKPVSECETNEDWLKSLSRNELAWFIATTDVICRGCNALDCNEVDCVDAWEHWLGLEHKENK